MLTEKKYLFKVVSNFYILHIVKLIMLEAQIKPESVVIRQKEKEIRHHMNQFEWFEAGLFGVNPDTSRISIVHFDFPHGEKLVGAGLFVLGQGITMCGAYFSSYDRHNRSQIWEIFNYNLGEEKEIFKPKKQPLLGVELNHFTTREIPFLHRGNYPPDFARVYDFYLFGSERLEVRAQGGEQINDAWMSVFFHLDSRKQKPYELVKIICDGKRWYSPELEE